MGQSKGERAPKRAHIERETIEAKKCKEFKRQKYPSISLDHSEVVKKVQVVLDLICASLLAIPFIAEKKEKSQKQRPESITEVKQKLHQDGYKKTYEVFRDLENIFATEVKSDQEVSIFIGGEEAQQKFLIKPDQREEWGRQLKRDLCGWIEKAFVNEDALQQPVHSKILSALTRRFPHVGQDQLKVASCQVAESRDSEKWKSVLQKVNELNANSTPGVAFKKYRLVPSKHIDFEEEHLIHKITAGLQFHKMIAKWTDSSSSIPVPIRTVSNPSDAIAQIDYIRNPKLEKMYEAQKKKFLEENKDAREVLLFHGTSTSCIESILKTNFLIDHLPVQQTNKKDLRDKKMMFGRGVYFSELPAVSLMYGNGLILCRVLLGNCQEYRPVAAGEQPDIPQGFDSRQVITKDGSSVIHVVKETPQILPYCVIQLKNDSISSEYRKPGPTPSVSCATFTTTTTTPTTATVIKADPPSTLSKEVRVEKTLKAFTRPIPPKLTMRIALCQSTGNARVATQEESVCPVCLEPLETGVVALPCSHKLHEDCARKVVEFGQTGPDCLQCPECKDTNGVRTGNQPLTGDMTWTTIPHSLPAHLGHDTIVIKYRMEGGVQGEEHSNPGRPYQARGFPRMAYLPDSDEGRSILSLLTIAFRRRLIFTVGPSLTRGEEDCVTWAGIHHKTKMSDGEHGFPDPGYLYRVREELKARGVSNEDRVLHKVMDMSCNRNIKSNLGNEKKNKLSQKHDSKQRGFMQFQSKKSEAERIKNDSRPTPLLCKS